MLQEDEDVEGRFVGEQGLGIGACEGPCVKGGPRGDRSEENRGVG